jgi:hypothetical protein
MMMVSCAESICSAVAGGGGGLGPPMSSASASSPVRPLLLRSDVAWTPEEGTRGPGASSASASSRSVSAVSCDYVPPQDMIGERILRDYEAYMAGLRAGVAGAMEGSYRGHSGGGVPREGDAYRAGVRVGMAGAAEAVAFSVRSVSGSTISPVSCPTMVPSGGDSLRSGWANPPEEEKVYELPPDVVERLSFQETLSAGHRRERGKRRRGDGSAELDEAVAKVASGSASPGRDDEVDEGGGEGASGGGCPTT